METTESQLPAAAIRCQSLKAFDLFPKLPIELRTMIWRHALPGPRLVRVMVDEAAPHFGSLEIDRHNGSGRKYTHSFNKLREQPARPPPQLLHVCRESRQIALETYDFCFSTQVSSTCALTKSTYIRRDDWCDETGVEEQSYRPMSVRSVPHTEVTWAGVRFQPTRDIIYLVSKLRLWKILTEAKANELKTENIRCLAVSDWLFQYTPFRLLGCDSTFFSGLKELIVVAKDEDEASRDGVEDAAISVREKRVREQMRSYKEESPDFPFPVVKVMTEAMLIKYIDKEDWQGSERNTVIH